jgi:hypothetical protein
MDGGESPRHLIPYDGAHEQHNGKPDSQQQPKAHRTDQSDANEPEQDRQHVRDYRAPEKFYNYHPGGRTLRCVPLRSQLPFSPRAEHDVPYTVLATNAAMAATTMAILFISITISP